MSAGTGTAGDGLGQGVSGTIEELKEGQRQIWRQNSAVAVGLLKGPYQTVSWDT